MRGKMNHKKIPAVQVVKTINENMVVSDEGSVTVVELDNGKRVVSVSDGNDTISVLVNGLY